MSFASLIGLTPEKGMKLLKGAIEQTLNKKVESFELIYNKLKQQVDFEIIYPNGVAQRLKYDESKKLCIILDAQLKDHIPKGSTIDYAIVKSKELTADIYTSSEQGKKKQTISLI